MTTIVVPPNTRLWTIGPPNQIPTFVPSTEAEGTFTTIAPNGFALYLPITAGISSATVNGAYALNILAFNRDRSDTSTVTAPPTLGFVALSNGGIGSAFTRTDDMSAITLPAKETLYVAFTASLPNLVSAAPLIASLTAAVTPAPSSTTATSTTGTSTSNITSTTSTNTPSPGGTSTPDNTPFSLGVLVGGIFGAFVGALIICALAWFIFRRRKSPQKRPAKQLSDGGSMSRELVRGGQRHSSVSLGEVPGWHKHLPQEKDDSTIKRNFNEVLHHVQMHIEGFYEPKSGRVPDKTILALGALAGDDDYVLALKDTENALPVLEGILVRWIIHRISLLSDPSKSLLPSEYTTIPASNSWNMESKRDVLAAESRKGFAPAFSEWRVLTGFLHPQIKADPNFKRQLDQRIAAGVQEVSTQFAFWEVQGKSENTRAKSLRQILVEASDLGMLLFTQPSTYQFEWSGKDVKAGVSSKVRTPALVKRLDGTTDGTHAPKITVEAKLFNTVRN